MANEIALACSFRAYKSSVMSSAFSRAVAELLVTMSGNPWVAGTISVGTSAEAIPLGEVASLGWAFFLNKDATNFIKIRNGSGGADLLKLKAGEFAVGRLLDTAAPYAIADTAACLLEYAILSN